MRCITANPFKPGTQQQQFFLIFKPQTMKTIKDFTTAFMNYGLITVPAGTITTNQTACGIDKNYNFVNEFKWVETNYPEFANLLLHDLTYYGLDIPAEYIEKTETEIKEDSKKEVITQSEKLTETIKEFYEAKEFEKCDYCVNPQHDRNGWYFLVNIKDGKIVCDGTHEKLRSYLNLRKVNHDKVYKYSYINHKFITING